jgi:hypothetical protein
VRAGVCAPIILSENFSIADPTTNLQSTMTRQRKVLVPINAPKSRKKRVPQQTKDIQAAIMNVILNEIKVEKEKRFCNTATNRAASYGVMDAVLKKHKEANPWLTRDMLNNYKRRQEKIAEKSILLDITSTKRDSISTIRNEAARRAQLKKKYSPQRERSKLR